MYFCIIRDNGFINQFVLKFSDYISVENDNYIHYDDPYVYDVFLYNISDISIRRLKLKGLCDDVFRRSVGMLFSILDNERFVVKFSEFPVSYSHGNQYGSFTFSYGIGRYYVRRRRRRRSR